MLSVPLTICTHMGPASMNRRHPSELIKSIDGQVFVAPQRRGQLPVKRASGVATHLAWATGGFVVGAICWHMVGFWTFIDRVLDETTLMGKPMVASTETARSSVKKTSARLLSEQSGDDCVLHVQVDLSDQTTVQPCAMPVLAMQQQ